MNRAYYSDTIINFKNASVEEVLAELVQNNEFSLEQTQRDAWTAEINTLQKVLFNHKGAIYFEYSIPRMGRRIDVLLLIGPVIFVCGVKPTLYI